MDKKVKAIGVLVLVSLVLFIGIANANLVVDFYFEPETPLTFQNVFFWDASTYNGENLTSYPYAINFSWNFGDGYISYEKNTTHTYSIPGIYNVTHRVILYNESGIVNDSMVTKQIHVLNRPPAAKFYWNSVEKNFTFYGNFNYDASYDLDGYIANYTWDFGDGSIGYGAVVNHRYEISGGCNVTLTVTDNNGSTNSMKREINISNKMPFVNFSYYPDRPTSLDNITFTSNSYDLDGYIANYTWDFGDGNIFYNHTITYRFNDSGIYRIYLFVIDNEGAFNYTWKDVRVYNIPPVANFSWEPFYPIPNKNIVFNASNSYDLDGYIANYTWDFGDGNISYGMIVEHSYNSSGIYNVTLTVFDDDGEIASITYAILVADFYVDKNVYDPDNHTWNKINDALNNATDGTFIYIREGIYEEDIDVGKEVSMEGIDAEIRGNVSLSTNISFYRIGVKGFSFSANQACEIRECKIEATKLNVNKKNLFFDNIIFGEIEVGDENIFRNNSIEGGLDLRGDKNEFYENKIYDAFYGFNIRGEFNRIVRNEIKGCIYGIYLRKFNEIVSNEIKSNGFGIYLNVGNIIIGYNKVEGNYYGIYAADFSNITFFELSFSNNTFAIYSENAHLYVENATIKYGKNGIFTRYGEIVNSMLSNLENGIVANNALIKNCSIKECKSGITANEAEIYYSNFEGNDVACYINMTSIKNCSFSNNDYGIKAGSDNSISNCSFSNNSVAIVCEGKNNSIYSSIIYKNNGGIYLKNSFNSVYENIINENEYGLRTFFSPYNNIYRNNFTANKYNFDMEGSDICHFYQSMGDNKADNLSFLYLVNESNIEINGSYGYIAMIDCKNISLSNFSNSHAGEILLAGCENVSMKNGVVCENIEGIYVLKGNGAFFENITIRNNLCGICSKSSHNLAIYNCSFEGNEKGINLFNMEREFSDVKMMCLNFYGNTYGFSIENANGVNLQDINGSNNGFDGVIYNADVWINSSNISIISFKNSDLRISNSTISKIYGENSYILIFNGSIKDCKLQDNEIYFNYSELSGNSCITGGNFYAKNSIFYENGKISFNLSKILIENSTFEKNNLSEFINSEGFLNYSIFSNNSIGILIENSTLSIINAEFYKNDVGIYINSSDCKISSGNFSENNLSIMINGTNNIVEKILIHHNKKGALIYGNENEIKNCSFWRNEIGIEAYGENRIYSNNFIYNSKNAIEGGNNTWNLSYPYGGNYWHDYPGRDLMKGEGQNISGSDGIGDTPYQINASYDYYPLMQKCDAAFVPNEKPVARFYFYPSTIFSLETIMFFDSSYDENGYDDIISWLWNFGDGNSSNNRNPMHTYNIPGNYTIRLVIKDRGNETSTFSLNISVKNIPPYANFSFKENAKSYEIIEFNASKSYDLDGYIANYTWDFGDGSIGYGNISSHKYTKPGVYRVKLVVIDNNGSKSEVEKEIEIVNREPIPDFIFSPEEARAGEEIEFTDISTDMDGEIVSYIWKFGDGNISYDKNPSHIYEKPGEYEITLIIKDNNGAASMITKTIKVKKKEMPSFEFVLFAIAVLLLISRKRKK